MIFRGRGVLGSAENRGRTRANVSDRVIVVIILPGSCCFRFYYKRSALYTLLADGWKRKLNGFPARCTLLLSNGYNRRLDRLKRLGFIDGNIAIEPVSPENRQVC